MTDASRFDSPYHAPVMVAEILDAFRDAAEEFGVPKIEDFNRGDNAVAARLFERAVALDPRFATNGKRVENRTVRGS